MRKLQEKLNAFWKAAEEFENCAITVQANRRCTMSLAESRLMREKALDAQVRGARGERAIFNIPIVHGKKLFKTKNEKRT